MLRQVARVLRISLLLVGVSLVVWTPLSFILAATLTTSWPTSGQVLTAYGVAAFSYVEDDVQVGPTGFSINHIDPGGNFDPWLSRRDAVVPRVSREKTAFYVYLTCRLPLWLLATICLAWPVTSFILHRRRHKRGFPVVAKKPAPEGANPPAPG